MSQDTWTAVDRYIGDLLIGPDHALEAALADSEKAGLPAIAVSAAHGKLLHLLARAMGAKRILEIGTLGGYSTIWLARATPKGGKLITLEFEPKHAKIAKQNIARAGMADVVEIRIGAALDLLPTLQSEAPFDFFFIDADKEHNTEYFQWAVKLGRKGSVIIVDNVVRDGEVLDPKSTDARIQGVRRFNEALAAEKRVSATEIQTVGIKGYDGFAIAVVTAL